ncbi:MAG: glycosyltransferase family 4 protein [Halobacteriota archaeon]
MKDKRVLVLIPHDNGEDNGITIRTKVVCDILNHEYDIAALGPESSYAANVVVLSAKFLIWMLKLTYLIPQQNADCVYCCADYFGFLVAHALSKVFSFPVVFEAQGILSAENKAKNRPGIVIRACSLIERFVISRADYVVALSGNILKFYAKYNANIELIPVFVNESAYHRSRPRTPDLKTIGLIGPFDNPQNKPYLEFLYDRIDEFDPRIRFEVIGRGADKIANPRVTYMEYISSRDEYAAELASLDALLVPARFNMAGPLNKILEAMASSLPVFTTPEGAHGLDDYAERGTNILVANPSELAACVNHVIFDEARCSVIGANARATIEQRYSETTSSARLSRIIRALLDGS